MKAKAKKKIKAKTKVKPVLARAKAGVAKVKKLAKRKIKGQMKATTTASTKLKTKKQSKQKAGLKTKMNELLKSKPKSKTKSKGKISFIAKGYSSITPYLVVKGAETAIKFYKKVFDAKEVLRMDSPEGLILHSEMLMGDSKIMLSDEFRKMKALSPKTVGGTPVGIHLYVKNVDKVIKRAVAAGAKLQKSIEDTFYGDRMGAILDPFGHQWTIATHIEDVSSKEMQKRMSNLSNKKKK